MQSIVEQRGRRRDGRCELRDRPGEGLQRAGSVLDGPQGGSRFGRVEGLLRGHGGRMGDGCMSVEMEARRDGAVLWRLELE